MGFVRTYNNKKSTRYQALYMDHRGKQRSAGTFSTYKEAERAWQAAEVKVREGIPWDHARRRQRFRNYVEDTWLPNHRMEPSTRQDYISAIYKHIMPYFGDMRMNEIFPEHIQQWITHLKAKGVTPRRIQYCKVSVLNAIFTTALRDHVVVIHPSRGIETDPVPEKIRKIITVEQFDAIYQRLPDSDAQLLIETDIESGLRWGELTELRVKDLDFTTGILTISRAVIELTRKNHPEGKRFLVKEYPKNRKHRRFKLSAQIVAKLKAHVEAHGLKLDDLFFSRRDVPAKPHLEAAAPGSLEFEAPNGRTYTHGTITAYSLGKCKCDHCRAAYATYRAKRRAGGKDGPRRPRAVDTDPHIPANWFRKYCWYPARDAAGLDWSPRIHDLRHAHASWLLAGGADLQVVKERLGHLKLATTEKYLHSLPNADETALTALNKIRSTARSQAEPPATDAQLDTANQEIARLRAVIADLTIAQHSGNKNHLRPA
ncbi:site-specific integrase [Actinomadura sp. WMMA1423]|uniref:tyrosine-type recombinase/integrase n=1 Tax=Actinomadura sp. WMMA1423 TaxID=2591108 RepID=UPI001147142A|nr:site-specific integrase [Actinomadura sp. WMMA1423]